jgi:hypothetical protein
MQGIRPGNAPVKAIQAAMGALQGVMSPLQGAVESGFGREADELTKGVVPARVAGDVVGALSGMGGEFAAVNDGLKATKGAKTFAEWMSKYGKGLSSSKQLEAAAQALARSRPGPLDPKVRAANRIMGAAPKEKTLAAAQDAAAAGMTPTMMGSVPRRGIRLTRNAKVISPDAEEHIANYQEGRRPELVQESTDRIMRESSLRGSPLGRVNALDNEQGALADVQYAKPYATPVKMTMEGYEALSNPVLEPAINEALIEVTARKSLPNGKQQLAELQALMAYSKKVAEARKQFEAWKASHATTQPGLGPERFPSIPPPPIVSAATWDRIRHFAGRMARGLERSDPAKAGTIQGLKSLKAQLDTVLDAVPELKQARAVYRQYEARKRLAELPPTVIFGRPEGFASAVKEALGGVKMTPAMQKELTHTIIHSLSQKAGTGISGLMSVAGSAAEGANFRANMTSLVGEANAVRLERALKAAQSEAKNLNYVMGGSPTADKMTDAIGTARDAAALVGSAAHFSPVTFAMHAAALIERLKGVTPEEGAEIAKLMVSQKPPEQVYQDMKALVDGSKLPRGYTQDVMKILNRAAAANAAQQLSKRPDPLEQALKAPQ